MSLNGCVREVGVKPDWPNYDEDNPNSIAIEVLSQLEILNYQLITINDIPAIVTFLNTPIGEERNSWRKWKQYWDDLDMDARMRELENNPYYCI